MVIPGEPSWKPELAAPHLTDPADEAINRKGRRAAERRGPPISLLPVRPVALDALPTPQLEEALAHGPDPLHLAAVFGLDPNTAIRYAENARLLLTTRAEEQDPASSREPKGQNES
jgi:hypothetical protein